MKKTWGKRLLLLLLCVLLLGALILPAAGSSPLYFMAVNDRFFEMTPENLPMVVNGVLYIPYTMLSSQVAGISLGVRAQYNLSQGTLIVTNDTLRVTFDIRAAAAYDQSGSLVSARAISRNTMVYLPIDWLCGYFDELHYSIISTSTGPLIRLKNSSVVLTDAEFADAAASRLYENLLSYKRAQAGSNPSGSPSPTPTGSGSGQEDPSPVVYLALRWGEEVSAAADLLDQVEQPALFLFPVEQLVSHDDLIRRLVGRGHEIGLLLTGEDPETCLEQLARGRKLLADIARCPVLIAAADNLNADGTALLEQAGCAVWNASVQADSLTKNQLLRKLSASAPNYIELTCSATGIPLLLSVLPTLAGTQYQLLQPLAPLL